MSDNAPPDNTLTRPQLRSLHNELLGARDQQILRVVAMVDALPHRGEADFFIAPLRPRLSVLRPGRRLTFARLMFLPLDPLIVAAQAWRRDALTVPRSVLVPLAAVVHAGLGSRGPEIDRAIAGLTTEHDAEISQLGPEVWGAAAEILAAAPTPTDWTDLTGLQDEDHRAIVALVAATLDQAAFIEELLAPAANGKAISTADIGNLLTNALAGGPAAFAAMIALLAARLPHAGPVFAVADDLAGRRAEPAARLAVDHAIDATIDTIEIGLASQSPMAAAAACLRDIVGLFEDVEAHCDKRPSRKARVAQLRRALDTANREKFSRAIDGQLLAPAETLADATDEAVLTLETTARDLRRFEGVARRLGGAEHYDTRLRDAATALKPRGDDNAQTVIDRVRLIEILQGPEVAMRAMSA